MLKWPVNQLLPLLAMVWKPLEGSLANSVRLRILKGPGTGLPSQPQYVNSCWSRDCARDTPVCAPGDPERALYLAQAL